jgi:hypothetical protein
MASIFDVGSIAQPGADFASTGPHLHVSVQDPGGKTLDPTTARSFLLSRILVGKNKTPLYSKSGENWQSAYQVTSPFGQRSAPTAGASTDHQGTDFGIPQGQRLGWLANPGDVYTPNQGYGTIQTTDPQGKPYTVKLLHTVPGAAAGKPTQQGQQLPAGNIYNFYFGNKLAKNEQDPYDISKFLNNYINTSLPTFDSVGLVNAALNASPNYFT